MPNDQNLKQLELLAQQSYLQNIKSPWSSVGGLLQQLSPFIMGAGSALAQQEQASKALDAQVSQEAARQRGFEEKRAHETELQKMEQEFRKQQAEEERKLKREGLDIERKRADAYGQSVQGGKYSEALGGESTKAMRQELAKHIDKMMQPGKGADGLETPPFLNRNEGLAALSQLYRASNIDDLETSMQALLRSKDAAQNGPRGDYEYDKAQGLAQSLGVLGLGGGGAGGLLQQPQGMMPQTGTIDPKMMGSLLKQIGGGDPSVMTGTPSNVPTIMDQLFETVRGQYGLMPGDANYEEVMVRAKHYLDKGLSLEEAVDKAASEYGLTKQGVSGNAGRPALLSPPGAK